LPVRNVLLSTGPIEDKAAFLESARTLRDLGVKLFATQGTAAFLHANGIESSLLHWPTDPASPNTLEYLAQGRLDLVINIPKNSQEEELTNDYLIRRKAADFGIPLITNIQLAQRFVEAISRKRMAELQVKSWDEYAPLKHSSVTIVSAVHDAPPAAGARYEPSPGEAALTRAGAMESP
jgi:carbamoyl-phosphate synthase large subunit